MNRSNSTHRFFSTSQLRAALGDVGGAARPDYLADITAQAGRVRQRPAWTFLAGWRSTDIGVRRHDVTRAAVLFTVLSLLVALLVAGVLYSGSPTKPPPLQAAPDAWSRVRIELPSGNRGWVVSLAASPGGLIAVLTEEGGNDETRLATSADGRAWTLVPDSMHPGLINPRSFGFPAVVGTERGFLLLQLGQVWESRNGYGWERLAVPPVDSPDAAIAGGPGFVGVGGNRAWYSEDGSAWSTATVPALPAAILERPESERYVGLRGVTAAGNDLVAWGIAEVALADNPDEHLVMPLLWASDDGRTWTDVVDPLMGTVSAVAGGPTGFVAVGQAGTEPAGWFSADGRAWQRIAGDAFESSWPKGPDGLRINDDPGDIPVELTLASAAAGSAGYVLVGGDGQCVTEGFCASDEAAIWTSADGRSWSRVPKDDRFSDGRATAAIAWGSRFVVGGVQTDTPAIWISGSAP